MHHRTVPIRLAARFCHPGCVAPDRFGNIIVTEFFGHHIHIVWRDGSQSGVTTIAGKGPTGASGGSSIDSDTPLQASFFTPLGIASMSVYLSVYLCVYS